MATVASLQVLIGANTKGLQREIANVQKTIRQKLGGNAIEISENMIAGVAGLSAALAGLGAVAVRSAAQMEQTEKAFTTLLKSADSAKDFLAELERFAAATPFELPGLLNASKRLLAFGFSAQQVIPILTAIGDSAAALGMGEEGISRLTTAIGQIQAKAKVSAEEMNQINETGIPAWQLLADTIGTTVPQAMDMASKGMIDGATGVQAILTGMNKQFGGMMAEQSQTLNGMMSNIQDSIGQLSTVVGKEITEAFNLKDAAAEFQDTLGEFTAIAKQSGIGEALRQMVPTEVGMAIGALAAVITSTAVPAIVLLTAQAAKAALAFVGITGPIGIAVAAIGAGAYLIWDNWAALGKFWDTFWVSFDHAIATSVADIQDLIADLVSSAAWAANKLGGIFGFEESGSGMRSFANQIRAEAAELRMTADNMEIGKLNEIREKYAESIPKTDSSFASADINNLGLQNIAGVGGTSSGGNGSGAGAFTELNREIDRLNTEINEAKEKTLDLQSEFNNFALDIKVEGLSEFDQVYAGIVKERDQRIAAVEDWQAKFSNAVTEAEQFYERAMKTGDENVMANALAMLEQRKAAQIAAEQESSAAILQINQTMNEQLLSQATLMQAMKAKLDELYRQTDLEGYIAYLDAEKAAFMQQQTEMQEMMSAYQEWRMEAESTYLSFALEAANTLKNGLAQGLANAIVYGDNFGKTLKNMGKQIIAMFIQWQVQRMAAAALSKGLMAKETAEVAAQGAAMAAALSPAAWAKLVIDPGAGAVATATLTAGLSAAAGIGAASGAITSLAPGGTSGLSSGGGMSFGAGMDQFNQTPSYFANGGIVTGTTIGVIGEKSYDEAVIPLRSSVLESLASFLIPNMQSTGTDSDVTVNVNNYGDINNGSDYDDLMNDIAASVAAGTRGVRFAT